MEADLFIHGVPHGWDFWGKESDRAYFGNFYKPNQVPHQLVVETRISGGHPYAYYHYLLNADVVDYEGRDGSYVGVSVRIDAYCRPTRYMWLVLDRLFTQHLRPLLFEQAGPKLRWRVAALRLADKQVAAAQDQLLQLMGATLRATDFEAIGTDIATRTNTGVSLCTVDASDERVRQAVMQFGRVSVSDTHAADRERQTEAQHKQQVTTMQATADQLKAAYRQLRHEAEQAQDSLQQQVRTQQTEMQRLQMELKKSEQQLQRATDGRQPWHSTMLSSLFGQGPGMQKWLPLAGAVLLVLIIVLLCVIGCGDDEADAVVADEPTEQPIAVPDTTAGTTAPDSLTIPPPVPTP